MLKDPVTTTEAAAACGVGYSTISMWVSRGYLEPLKVEDLDVSERLLIGAADIEAAQALLAKHPRYRLGDVMIVARDTRRRAVGANRIF